MSEQLVLKIDHLLTVGRVAHFQNIFLISFTCNKKVSVTLAGKFRS